MFAWTLEMIASNDGIMVWQVELRNAAGGWHLEASTGWSGAGQPIREFAVPVKQLEELPDAVRVLLEQLESCQDAQLTRFKEALKASS